MCCLQDNRTPLDLAVQYDSFDSVHFLLKECKQDTTKLKQVCKCVVLLKQAVKEVLAPVYLTLGYL